MCKIPSVNKPVSSIASMSKTCPSPDLAWEGGGGGCRLGPWRTLRGQRGARLPLPSVPPRNHAGAEVSGVWLADLASSDAGCSSHPPPTPPSLPGAPALVYWPTPYKNKNRTKNDGSPRRKEGPRRPSSPQRHPLRQPAVRSRLLSPASPPRTPAQQGPAAPQPGRRHTQSAASLTQGTAGQRLGVVCWAASGALASLSWHSCH